MQGFPPITAGSRVIRLRGSILLLGRVTSATHLRPIISPHQTRPPCPLLLPPESFRCHPERGEGSRRPQCETLCRAQGDMARKPCRPAPPTTKRPRPPPPPHPPELDAPTQ